MVLTLEVSAPQPAQLGAARLKEFGPAGGVIGRNNNNDWVLPHAKVSGCHARISFSNGRFYLEDTSTNGVFLNSRTNRLSRGRPHPLTSGDRIVIDPYEIDVSISASSPLDSDDPFGEPAFSGSHAGLSREPSNLAPSGWVDSEQELDPLKLLDGPAKRAPAAKARSAKDLDGSSLLAGHFKPPPVVAAPKPRPAEPDLIPLDYDPLAPDEPPASEDWQQAAPEKPAYDPPAAKAVPEQPGFKPPAPAPPDEWPPPTPSPVVQRPVVVAIVNAPLEPEPVDVPAPPPVMAVGSTAGLDLEAMFEGAGLDRIPVTAELARSFGQIFRVVVSGVMDVLQARHQIKDEFRMRVTHVRPVDNNPLKFSANVDDALHNLLVKRNAAFLGPVEAFEDAFDDLRKHQIALLAGMRMAYESMLAQFDPDRLQEHFDRQVKKGSILGLPAKLRYWEQYRDRYQDLVQDPDASFVKLFRDEFAKAYEQQLKRLQSEETSKGPA